MSATEETNAAATPVVDDANDLRGFHFKRLMKKRLTLILTAAFVIAAGVAGALFVAVAVGGLAAIGVLLLAIVIVFFIADSKSEDAFFEAYAKQRGLTLGGRTSLPAATPLLCKGDDRYAQRTLTGPLAEGIDGTLALYTYEEETTDSKGNRQTSYYHYTVTLVDIPECVSFVPELYCQQKFGFKFLEKFEDVFRGSKERVKFESEQLDDRYEIFTHEDQDENWLRQLFSPTFIVWLTDSAPKKFGFELVEGTLCCFVNSHKDHSAELDEISAATAGVVARLREESLE